MVMGPEPTTATTEFVDETLNAPVDTTVAVPGRSLGRIAWSRLKRDKVAMVGAFVIILLVLVAIFAPLIVKLFGHDPAEFHTDQLARDTQLPKGAFGGINSHFLLGVEPRFGQDIFSNIVYGSRISLIIAFLATMLSVVIGTVFGIVAGYFGGWVDAVISRVMDVLLAFPLLLFALDLVGVIPDHAFGLTGNTLRIAVIVFIIGFFTWPYVGRIIRGQALSLREREFVEAARSLGARPSRIIFREILPNLLAPILIYSSLLIPTNILFEAALDYFGVGVPPPTPTWGGMLADSTEWFKVDTWDVLWPGLAIFVTVLAFNLFGDGLRDAFDPRAR